MSEQRITVTLNFRWKPSPFTTYEVTSRPCESIVEAVANARTAAFFLGYTPVRWWQWWRWGEPSLWEL